MNENKNNKLFEYNNVVSDIDGLESSGYIYKFKKTPLSFKNFNKILQEFLSDKISVQNVLRTLKKALKRNPSDEYHFLVDALSNTLNITTSVNILIVFFIPKKDGVGVEEQEVMYSYDLKNLNVLVDSKNDVLKKIVTELTKQFLVFKTNSGNEVFLESIGIYYSINMF